MNQPIAIGVEKYKEILDETASEGEYATALKRLSIYRKKYHGRNVIILIDEYDVPLENAYFRGYYDQIWCSALITRESW